MANWIREINPDTGSGNGTVEIVMDTNSGAERTATLIVSGVGVPDRAFTITQEVVELFPVVLWGRGTQAGQFDGADTPDEAMNNTIQQTVYSTTPASAIGIGTRFYANQQATESLDGGTKWFKLGETTSAVQIDPEGYWIATADTSLELYTTPASLINIFGEGQNRSVQVFSNTSWSVSSKPSWVTVNGADSGSGNGSLSFTFAPNTGGSPRTGSIRLVDSAGYRDYVISIQQGTAFIVTPGSWDVPTYAGGSQVFNIQTTGPWSVAVQEGSPGPQLITINPNSGTGDGSFTVQVARNYDEQEYTRFVEVQSQGRFRVIQITIPKAPTLTVTPSSRTVSATTTTTTFTITSDTSWTVEIDD